MGALQENMTRETLVKELMRTWEQRDALKNAVRNAPPADGTNRVMELIEELRKA